MYDFPVQDCTQEQNSNPYFSSGRLCQGRLLRSRNFATMATWRHTSPLCTHPVEGTEGQCTLTAVAGSNERLYWQANSQAGKRVVKSKSLLTLRDPWQEEIGHIMKGYICIIIMILTAIPFLNKFPKRAIYKSAQRSTAVDLRTEPCVTFFASVARQNPANSERRNDLGWQFSTGVEGG